MPLGGLIVAFDTLWRPPHSSRNGLIVDTLPCFTQDHLMLFNTSVTKISGGAAVLIAVTVLVYAHSFNGPFVYDDLSAIVRNPHIRTLWPPTEMFRTPPRTSVTARPIVAVTLAVNYQVSGMNVWSYHALNLLLHMGSAVLLMAIVYRTLGRLGIAAWLVECRGRIAFAVALLWAVHPLNSEAVLYIIQRTELLVSGFCLLSLWLFMVGVEARCSWPWYLGAILACWLGVGSKELAYAIPLIVLLYDRAFVADRFREALRHRWPLHMGLLASWLPLMMILLGAPRSGVIGFDQPITPWQYLYTQGGVIFWYLRLCFVPWPLSFHHDWPIASAWAGALPGGLLVVGFLVLTIVSLVRWPRVGFASAVVFLLLAPTSSVVPIVSEIAAERRMYLPLAAVLVLVVVGGCRLSRRLCLPHAMLPVLAAILVTVAGLATAMRVEDYRTDRSIWQDVLDLYPKSAVAWCGVGATYYKVQQFERAREYFDRAVQINPNSILATRNLGNTFLNLGRTGEAITWLSLAVEMDPAHPGGYGGLGLALMQSGDFEGAERVFQRGLNRYPGYRPLLNSLGRLYHHTGRTQKAVETYHRMLELDPRYGMAHAHLGVLFLQAGRFDDAEIHLGEAIALGVDDVNVHVRLASVLLEAGRVDQAESLYRQVLAREPGHIAALTDLSIILQNQGKLDEAGHLANRLVTLQPESADAHNNLGVIYAASGRIAKSAEQFTRALKLDPEHINARTNLDRAHRVLQGSE